MSEEFTAHYLIPIVAESVILLNLDVRLGGGRLSVYYSGDWVIPVF
jgi:hypothetical protein